MTAASQPQLVTLRSGDVVRIRPVRPDDGPALVRAYANLGEQSRLHRAPVKTGGPAYSGRSTAEPSQWVARSASSTS